MAGTTRKTEKESPLGIGRFGLLKYGVEASRCWGALQKARSCSWTMARRSSGVAVHVSEAIVHHLAAPSDRAIGWHGVGLAAVPEGPVSLEDGDNLFEASRALRCLEVKVSAGGEAMPVNSLQASGIPSRQSHGINAPP